jgi:hypothetical protein
VCRYLETLGYTIEQTLRTSERGTKVIARRGVRGEAVLVEAKGGTTPKARTTRHGGAFDPEQVFSQVSQAMFEVAKLLPSMTDHGTRIVVALPDTRLHRTKANQARRAFTRRRISVWLVGLDGGVHEYI